jgi:hypothetical protein
MRIIRALGLPEERVQRVALLLQPGKAPIARVTFLLDPPFDKETLQPRRLTQTFELVPREGQ